MVKRMPSTPTKYLFEKNGFRQVKRDFWQVSTLNGQPAQDRNRDTIKMDRRKVRKRKHLFFGHVTWTAVKTTPPVQPT
jgi:hypothetical protein